MEILESALAFAVVMIIFSTITTGIVELLLRTFGSREKTLEKAIRALFELIIWQRLEGALATAFTERKESPPHPHRKESRLHAFWRWLVSVFSGGGSAPAAGAAPSAKDQLLDEFVEAMMGNPVAVAGASSSTRGLPAPKEGQIDHLSVVAFAERLGRTEVGMAILAEGEKQMELLVTDFVRSFDRFARASQEVFRKRARQSAILVGIVFALSANIEAGRLVTTLMTNPNLRQSLIDQAEASDRENATAVDRLKELQTQLERGSADARGDIAKAIETEMKKISAQMEALYAKGLPVGHAYYPYCQAAIDPDCVASDTPLGTARKFLRWAFLCIVAGTLIGLGGPFWFRVFSGLSQVFQVLRSFGMGRDSKEGAKLAAEIEPETLPPPEESIRAKSVVEAFKVAATVHAQARGTGHGSRGIPQADG